MINNDPYKSVYTADGSVTTFDFPFRVLDESNILVQVINSSGNIHDQLLNVDYTVSGVGNEVSETDYDSGTITFIVAPLVNEVVIVKLGLPLTQDTDYKENTTFPSESHEKALDKLTLLVRQQQEELDRAFKTAYTAQDTSDYSLPSFVGKGDYYLRVNSSETALELTPGVPPTGIEVELDPSPKLGGDLDTNGNDIIGTDINLVTSGSLNLESPVITIGGEIQHNLDTDNKYSFGTDTQTWYTNGTSRFDINSSGFRIGTGSRVTSILSENDFASNSASALVTQNSIVNYVAGKYIPITAPVLGANLDTNGFSLVTTSGNKNMVFDPNGSGSITFTTDTGGVITLASANSVTVNAPALIVPTAIQHLGDLDNQITFSTDEQTFITGSTVRMDINNSGVRLNATSARVTTIFDDDTMANNSATALVTQQSIKAYVDNKSATQAQEEAGTVTTAYTSPGVQRYHPSACKAWAQITVSTSNVATLGANYNITSVSSGGGGGPSFTYTITIADDFSSANYSLQVFAYSASGGVISIGPSSVAAGSITLTTSTSGTAYTIAIQAFGDL